MTQLRRLRNETAAEREFKRQFLGATAGEAAASSMFQIDRLSVPPQSGRAASFSPSIRGGSRSGGLTRRAVMTVRAPDVSRLFVLCLTAAGLAAVAAGCRGPDPSTDVEDVAFASRNRQVEDFASRSRQFEDCCKHQLGPGRYRDECIEEARHGRCRLDCRPPRDAGAPNRRAGSPDAGTRDAGRADGNAGSPDAAKDAGGASCPTLTPITASATGSIPVGQATTLAIIALDPSGGAASLGFLGTATGGTLSSFSIGQNSVEADGFVNFVCTEVGTETITVTVLGAGCPLSESINVTCSLCGDGIVESGEQCDPPRPGICSSTCQFAAVCGDGIIGPGEQCDPPHQGPDGLQCGANCQLLTCGNGVIDPGEQCDPPKSSGTAPLCSQTCQIPACGNGVIDPGEQCDPPKSSGTAPLCSQTCQIPTCGNGVIDPGETCDPPDGIVCDSNCQSIPIVCGNGIVQPGEQCDGTPFCNQCQATTCGACFFEALDDAGLQGDPGCSGLTGTALTNCQNLLNCLTRELGECFFEPAGINACFCGAPTCPSAPNGQCGFQFEAVAGTTNPAVVLQQLADPTSLVSQVRAEGQAFANFPGCGPICSGL